VHDELFPSPHADTLKLDGGGGGGCGGGGGGGRADSDGRLQSLQAQLGVLKNSLATAEVRTGHDAPADKQDSGSPR
jgi:hypothetical protein